MNSIRRFISRILALESAEHYEGTIKVAGKAVYLDTGDDSPYKLCFDNLAGRRVKIDVFK